MARYPLAIGLAIISSMAMGPMVYAPDLKADWRDFSRAVAESVAARPGDRVLVIVASADPSRNVEVETARYYLPVSCTAIASEEATPERLAGIAAGEVYFAVGIPARQAGHLGPGTRGAIPLREERRYPGLIVYRGFSVAIVARGLQNRQDHRLEILVEGVAGHPHGLFGRGTDAQAAILDVGWDRAEAQHFDDLECPLDLGVVREILAGIGPQLVGPDGGASRSEGDPTIGRGTDPERAFDGDTAQVRLDLKPGHQRADPPLAAIALSFSTRGSVRSWSRSSNRLSSEKAVVSPTAPKGWAAPAPASGSRTSW